MSKHKTLEDAKEAIRNSSPTSSVYVGTDSIRYKKDGRWFARYSTVVILHIDSKHGCQLFYDTQVLPDYGNLKQRLMTEVTFAIEATSEIIDVIGNRSLAVHLDLNPNPEHKSHVAVKEALGYVRGSLGLDAVVKPASFAATHAADHLARQKLKY